jgi:hypothetical protein
MEISKTQIKKIANEVKKLLKEEEKIKQQRLQQRLEKKEKDEQQKLFESYKKLKEEKPQEFYEELLFEMMSIENDNFIDWYNNSDVENELEKNSLLWLCYNCDSDEYLHLINLRKQISKLIRN